VERHVREEERGGLSPLTGQRRRRDH
jgi:hypothetical protein